MVTLETQAKTEEIQLEKDTDNPEITPLYYGIPCAGVRYYTYDYRPAMQKIAARWAEKPEEERAA